MQTLVADRFEIQQLAGQGGMGTVFRALDTKTQTTVALKIVDGSFAATRFEREARLLEKLAGDGIVGYVAHGTLADGRMYLAMQWLEGESLDQRLNRGPLSIEDSIALTRRIAAALAKGHALGVIHRDVKPANIILEGGKPEQAMLLDFGIARTAENAGAITRTGVVIGTPAYMAPEQARGESSINARADAFSLGCVLFECLTGVTAWTGEHVVAILAKVLLEPAPRVRTIRRDVPIALDRLVAAMLEKKPEARPADVIAELDDLSDITPSSLVPVAMSLGPHERQFVSVLLVRRARDAETLEAVDQLAETIAPASASLHGIELIALANGALVGTEGGPDGALRIARCAVAMRKSDPANVIAIATGRAVIAGKLPVGEAIDRAAKMIAEHTTPGVWVDDATAAIVRGRFELNGSELASESAGDRVLGRVVPFVGRDREMALLEATYRETVNDAVASASLVVAEPGIGKSRLRRELVTRLSGADPPPTVWIGLAAENTAASQFALLADIITREKLEDRFLGAIAGRSAGDEDPALRAARADPQLLADRVTEAFVASAIAAAPLLLVLEDVHWADGASLAVVAELLAREAAVMVVAFARPEIDATHPKLWGARRVDLEPLGKKPAERIARAVLGEGAEVDAIVNRAHGNALFVEELARAYARGDVSELPPTLAAVAEARLLALSAEARQVLRAGAVFGERFWRDAARALVDDDIDPHIDELVKREVLFRAPTSRFIDTNELVFRHAVVRDAAYAMLTDEDRRLGHALAAQWLARRVDDPALLAYHQERGGLLAQAAESHALAAESAVNRSDRVAIENHVARSLACGATGHLRGRGLLGLTESAVWRNVNAEGAAYAKEALALLDRGSAPWFIAAGELAVASGKLAALDDLVAIVGEIEATPASEPRAARRRAIASARAAIQLIFMGDLGRARALIAGATFEAGDAAVEGALADAEFDRKFASGRILHPDVARHAARRYAAIGDRRGELAQTSNVAMALALIGATAEGVRVTDEVKPNAREVSALWYTRSLNIAAGAMFAGDVEPMITFTEALPVPRAQWGHWLWLTSELFEVDRTAARRFLDRSLDGVKPYPSLYTIALTHEARFAVQGGDVALGRRFLDEATALRARGLVVVGLNILPLARAEVRAAEGQADAARAALVAGLAEMDACAAELGEYAPVYLERGPGCAALVAAARRAGIER